MPFGYALEQEFDPAKEQRRARFKWAMVCGFALFAAYLFSGGPFAVEVFQGCLATVLCYGASFYVDRKSDLGNWWMWKAIVATVPVHAAYLVALFWSDKRFPNLMTKAIVFIPVVAVAFAIESLVFDRIVKRFEPSSASIAE